MKILLIGEYYSTNLGDPLLCRVVENAIKKEYPNAQIVPMDISGRTNYNTFYSPEEYSLRQRWYFRLSNRFPWLCRRFPLLRIYETDPGRHMRVISMLDDMLSKCQFDLAVFAGGSLFMDYFAGVIYDIVTTLAKKNIPVIFHACGMSRLTPDTSKVLYRAIHRPNVKWISLRDSYDLFVKRFSPRCPTIETYDTALLCSCLYQSNLNKRFDYGIGLMFIPEYVPFQKELVRWAYNNKKTWCLFTNGSQEDYEFAKNLLEEIGVPASYLIARPQTPQELMETIGSCNRILSFRMHSQVIASSFGIPSFGFAWNPKIVEFHNKLGFPNHSCVPRLPLPIENFSALANSPHSELRCIAMKQGTTSVDWLLKGIFYSLHT